MTMHDRSDRTSSEFDRLMAAWFESEAHVRPTSDLLERTLTRSSRTDPLPAWLLPERWLSMELTIRRARMPRAVPYLAILVILAILAVAAVAIVGSQPRVPAPFGLAANGSLAFIDDGRVAALDPDTGVSRIVVDGRGTARYPTFSRDGTRLAFVRPVDDPEHGLTDAIFAVDADGSGLVRLTDQVLSRPGLLTWSPDGSIVAFADDGRLWLARADGSGATSPDLAVTLVDELQWRPPDGRMLLFRGVKDGRAGLFIASADGSEPEAITPIDGGVYDYLWTSWSPDGDRVAYHRMSTHQIEIVTIGKAEPTVIRPEGDLGLHFPRFSPDGTRLSVMVWDGLDSSDTRIGVIPTDDPTPTVTLTGPANHGGIQHDWSPDGSKILAVWWTTSQPWILDPEGGEGVRAGWSMAIPDWVEWQRLAR
jgi:Tol biopolymer transport system component